MAKLRLELSRAAWITALAASIDAYRRESIGYLIGAPGNPIRVLAATVAQRKSKWTTHEVHTASDSFSRAEQAARACGLVVVGDWHSHPESHGVRAIECLGTSDEQELRETSKRIPGFISVLLNLEGNLESGLICSWRAYRINSRGSVCTVSGEVLEDNFTHGDSYVLTSLNGTHEK